MKTTLTLPLLALALLNTEQGFAMGKKPVDPKSGSTAIQAKPIRYVNLAKVTVPAFYLPNGARADLNSDLPTIIETQINSSQYFRTTNIPGRLIITGGVTSFEVDVLQLGLKIGWNKGDALFVKPGLPGVQGELDFKMSKFSMDFKIFDAKTGQTYDAKATDASISSLKLKITADISSISATLEAIKKGILSVAIRKATDSVMQKFEASSDFNNIPWEAKVLGIDLDHNSLSFNVGSSGKVVKDQVYSIYAGCADGTVGSGCFERWVTDIKVTQTGPDSASASPATPNDSLNSVWVGDKVFVKILASAHKGN
jgi:hypothetical protein